MAYGRGNPEVERVMAEMAALRAVIHSDTTALAHEAQAMVRAVESTWPATNTVTDFTIRAAMARITGSPMPSGQPQRTTGEAAVWAVRAFELVASAWIDWVQGDLTGSRFWLEQWARESADKTNLSKDGAIQAFAVALWANAIEALIEGRPADALRFFKRVEEVGGNFGTESHPTVLWTMAASFFSPEG